MKKVILAVILGVTSVSAFAEPAKIEEKITDQITFDPGIGSKNFSADAYAIAEIASKLSSDFQSLNGEGRHIVDVKAATVKAPEGVADRIEFTFRSEAYETRGMQSRTLSSATLTILVDRICGSAPMSPCRILYSKP